MESYLAQSRNHSNIDEYTDAVVKPVPRTRKVGVNTVNNNKQQNKTTCDKETSTTSTMDKATNTVDGEFSLNKGGNSSSYPQELVLTERMA